MEEEMGDNYWRGISNDYTDKIKENVTFEEAVTLPQLNNIALITI
jgi:hypothetical protein